MTAKADTVTANTGSLYGAVRLLLARLGLPLALMLGLSGCVTETRGGFNVEVSQQQAFQDYLALARGYLEQGDLANSKRHLGNAAAIDRNSAALYAIWGLVYAREGETELADDSFRRSLRLDRSNAQTRNNYAAFLFASGRYDDAYRELEIVVQDTAYPARAQAFENLGMAALRLNRTEDAQAAFARAVRLNGNMLRSLLELTALNLGSQNISQAEAYYRNYLSVGQFYSIEPDARALWLGIQLALAQNDQQALNTYATQLETRFGGSPEYQLYSGIRGVRGGRDAN